VALCRERGWRERRTRRHDEWLTGVPFVRPVRGRCPYLGYRVVDVYAHLVMAGAFNATVRLPHIALGLGPVPGLAWSPNLFYRVMGREAAMCPGPSLLLSRQDPPRHPARLGCALA
jgi:hypothetical protein